MKWIGMPFLLLFLLAPAKAVAANCDGEAVLADALRARSILRDFDAFHQVWRRDLDTAYPLDPMKRIERRGDWIVGGEFYIASRQVTFGGCGERDRPRGEPPRPRMRVESVATQVSASYVHLRHEIEVRPFLMMGWDALENPDPAGVGATAPPSRGPWMMGVSVRATPWAEATVARFTASGVRDRHFVRFGVPRIGLHYDYLEADGRHRPDMRLGTMDYALGRGWAAGISGERRGLDRYDLIEPAVRWALVADEGEWQGWGIAVRGTAASEVDPIAFHSGRLRGSTTFTTQEPGASVLLSLRADATVFNGTDYRTRTGSGATGGAAIGGEVTVVMPHGAFSLDLQSAVNAPELLRDVPSARGQEETRVMFYLRAAH